MKKYFKYLILLISLSVCSINLSFLLFPVPALQHAHAYCRISKQPTGELSDYVSSPDDMLQQEKFLISQSPPVTFNEVIYEDIENNRTGITADTPNSNIEYITNTQINTNTSTKEPTKQTTLSKNPQMARIQRDLNSPSASLRVRAIRALK